MKINHTLLILLSLLAACSETAKSPEATPQKEVEKTVSHVKPEHTYYASYVGAFEAEEIDHSKKGTFSNLINISVTGLENGKAEGHSIIAGKDRPFSGTYEQEGSTFQIKANEPGDDINDGRFEFMVDTVKLTASGKWYCNNKQAAVPIRKFDLVKKTFAYNADNNFDESISGAGLYDGKTDEEGSYESITLAVTKLNASKQKLTKKDVENLYKGDLELIRNAIYARHGYSFRNRRMRYIFDNIVEWYIPVNVDVRSNLTELEKENIDLLKRYENHAEKYYDEYSR